MKNGRHKIFVDIGKYNIHYYKNDLLHHEKRPAMTSHNGTKTWYKDGKKHRVGEPASLWNNGNIEWYYEGLRHCETGPALIYPGRLEEYYIMGVQYAKEDFEHSVMKYQLHQKLQAEKLEKPKVKPNKI